MAEHNDHDETHIVPWTFYFGNFMFLMFMLLLTVWAAFQDFGDVAGVTIMLTIAIVKMLAVLLIFMHVWWSSRLTQVFVAAGFLWLVIMFVLTFSDYVTRPSETKLVEAGNQVGPTEQHTEVSHQETGPSPAAEAN